MAEEKKEGETGAATSLAQIAAESETSALGAAPKKDLSGELKAKQPEAELLARGGKLAEATELLLGLEKQARLANDVPTLKQTALVIVRLCHEQKDWDAVGRAVTTLSKRRAQRGAVVASVVQEAMGWLDEIDDSATEERLVVVLRDVSEGKIFAEKERAQLTSILAKMKEAAGDIAEAASIMQEVHVETYGALTKMEKIEFILEQVRLLLLKKDYVRAFIVSKKVQRKGLEEPGFEVVKVKFYQLMVEYHMYEKQVFELFQCHNAIYNTREAAEPGADGDGDAAMADAAGGDGAKDADDASASASAGKDKDKGKKGKTELEAKLEAEAKQREAEEKEKLALAAESGAYLEQRRDALQHAVIFVLLSSHSDEQQEALEALHASIQRRIEAGADQSGELAPFAALLKLFRTAEIMQWVTPHDAVLRAHPVLREGEGGCEQAAEWYELLHTRAVEHNLRVVAKCYNQVRTAHLAKMLGLSEDACEERVSSLVVAGTIFARMDRPAGVISFQRPRPAEEALDDWAGDISELLNLVATTSRLINKEMMVHKLPVD